MSEAHEWCRALEQAAPGPAFPRVLWDAVAAHTPPLAQWPNSNGYELRRYLRYTARPSLTRVQHALAHTPLRLTLAGPGRTPGLDWALAVGGSEAVARALALAEHRAGIASPPPGILRFDAFCRRVAALDKQPVFRLENTG